MSQSQFQNNSIFWVEVDKIQPNPYQPRREFDEERLKDLAESIRMYGVLQPLTVTRKEVVKEDGGLMVEYELIAGERRHRASKLAGLYQVPVIIRSGPEDAKVKLELAIIENLQREDLNAIDRAKAFGQLANEFGFTHVEIAKKVGKSREYVSNSIRLLGMPDEMQQAIVDGKMTEGHARPILMLSDRPEEQSTLFKEVIIKKITVREAERIARSIALDKVRKRPPSNNPRFKVIEDKLAESFGTRVHIEERQNGGQLIIDFFSEDDLQSIVDLVNASLLRTSKPMNHMLEQFIARQAGAPADTSYSGAPVYAEASGPSTLNEPEESDTSYEQDVTPAIGEVEQKPSNPAPESLPSKPADDEDMYSISQFTI